MTRLYLSLALLVVTPVMGAACGGEHENAMEQDTDAPVEATDALASMVNDDVASSARPPWQCSRCADGQPYMEQLDSNCPSGTAVWCRSIDCSTAHFSACGIAGFSALCPPGFVVSGWYRYNRICEAYTCTRIPFPAGTYSECDTSTCVPGFHVSGYAPSAGSCNGNQKVTCTAP